MSRNSISSNARQVINNIFPKNLYYIFTYHRRCQLYIFSHLRFKQEERSRKLSGARNKPRKISSNRGSINSLHSLSSSSAFLNKVMLYNTKMYQIFLITWQFCISRKYSNMLPCCRKTKQKPRIQQSCEWVHPTRPERSVYWNTSQIISLQWPKNQNESAHMAKD